MQKLIYVYSYRDGELIHTGSIEIPPGAILLTPGKIEMLRRALNGDVQNKLGKDDAKTVAECPDPRGLLDQIERVSQYDPEP